MRKLVLGGPGAGKTHRLLEIMEQELADGVSSHAIAFVSFTRKAVNEARGRAMKKFGLPASALPYFRTLHSLCYRQLGVRRSQVLTWRHLREIGDVLGVPITGRSEPDIADISLIGDRMLFLDNLARATGRELEDVWHEDDGADLSWHRLLQFSETLERYKEERGLLDFTDMLTRFGEEGADVGVRVAIVDEAQDLTPAQWRVADVAFELADRLYYAGDDDQAIYAWSGADVRRFLELDVDEREVLPRSHRIPRRVFRFAERLAKRIAHRYEKEWAPRDEEGDVSFIGRPSDVNLTEGTWYLLARNRCFLHVLEDECVRQGVTYTTRRGSSVDPRDVRAVRLYERARQGRPLSYEDATLVAEKLGVRAPSDERRTYGVGELVSSAAPGIWHDEFGGVPPSRIAYYLTVLRRGEKLTASPRVHVDTIHGVKGGEAENVLLMTDQTARTERGALLRPDDEARVFYVGATRARRALHVLAPQGDRGYSP